MNYIQRKAGFDVLDSRIESLEKKLEEATKIQEELLRHLKLEYFEETNTKSGLRERNEFRISGFTLSSFDLGSDSCDSGCSTKKRKKRAKKTKKTNKTKKSKK